MNPKIANGLKELQGLFQAHELAGTLKVQVSDCGEVSGYLEKAIEEIESEIVQKARYLALLYKEGEDDEKA